MKQRIVSVGTIIVLVLIIVVMCVNIFGEEEEESTVTSTSAPTTSVPTTVTTTLPSTTVAQTTVPVTSGKNSAESATRAVDITVTTEAPETKPQTTEEIIDKYSQLVNDFKKQRPAYKKKEYQVLPEEHRNFSSVINGLLGFASNYMVSEEDAEVLVRAQGSEEIINDVPIHNTETGCVLTDYNSVSWAKCDDMGDGTYKLSFSLKEEANAEPTPSDTLIPVSAHGAVMQPMAIADIMDEVNNVVSSIPGLTLNEFSLYYRDCEFSCIYDPKTDKVLSITHHIVIDIVADVDIFSSDIDGSARLLNEMFIYDITW